MEIRHLTESDHISMGRWPGTVTVSIFSWNDAAGMMVRTHLHEGEFPRRVELRLKHREVALFTHNFPDVEVPEYWQDSEVLWSQEIEGRR